MISSNAWLPFSVAFDQEVNDRAREATSAAFRSAFGAGESATFNDLSA